MRYVSTRAGQSPYVHGGPPATLHGDTDGVVQPVLLSEAISAGLAPDGGLFVPEKLPSFRLSSFAGAGTLAETAALLLRPFAEGDNLAARLDEICHRVFSFEAPLRELTRFPYMMPLDAGASEADTRERQMESRNFLLELFHGPTAAFKDFGARFLAEAMEIERNDRSPSAGSGLTTILTATSGDTGTAVASAFVGREGFRVVILYPDGRVSPRQAHQLGCFGKNITALRVNGSFDDCQRMVKEAFTDPLLHGVVSLSSANSINPGRLLPQMAYYAHAALLHWREHGMPLAFAVPTGNLGNALACIMARSCGLPIGDVLFATNANHTLADFFDGSDYRARASVPTLANAMDVGAPSNFERLAWYYPDAVQLRKSFRVIAVGDERIRNTIRSRHESSGEACCPHTATALYALQKLREEGVEGNWAAVATAHPAKFERIVEPLIGRAVEIPPSLAEMLSRPATSVPLEADYNALRDFLLG